MTQEEGGGITQPERLSVAEIKEIVDAHAEWLRSGAQKGVCAELNNANLEEADLQGVKLERAIIQSANLVNAYLQKAVLSEALLQGSELCGADLTEANLREAHLESADLQGAHLAWADLERAHLKLADLQEADLRQARLRDAELEGAKLHGAKLQGADLQGANLKSVGFELENLTKARKLKRELAPAALDGADLRNTDLSDAKLSDVSGLIPEKLGGANLANSKIPADIAKFEGLKHVEETSRNARTTFLAMLLGCVYSWLTIATTTDVRLLTNSASSPLPIIQTEIPIAWFYWAAPLLILSVYLYLHLYLHRLWHGLAALPAVFPDGKELHDKAYPWLLNGLVRAHFPILIERRDQFSRVQNAASIVLAWWVVPATLLLFWVRYLPRQDWIGTSLQFVCIVVAVGFGTMSYNFAHRTLRFIPTEFRWKTSLRDERTYSAGFVGAFLLVLIVTSWGSINGVRSSELELDQPRSWAPYIAARLGYDVFANFVEGSVSSRPVNYWEIAESERTASVTGASLRGASIRHLDAQDAFLVKVDFRFADLEAANLKGANLEQAILQEANLEDADLEAARLVAANLERANLRSANAEDANFTDAMLMLVDLEGASLVLADLVGADLLEARLVRANLEGAQLRDATIDRANLRDANLRRAHLEGASMRFSHLEGADLLGAKLQGADLRGAYLEGARLGWRNPGRPVVLDGANLEGANLDIAKLPGVSLGLVNLQGASLRWADLTDVSFQGADLAGADLRGARGVSCASLREATSWERAYRDQECGAPIPDESTGPQD